MYKVCKIFKVNKQGSKVQCQITFKKMRNANDDKTANIAFTYHSWFPLNKPYLETIQPFQSQFNLD